MVLPLGYRFLPGKRELNEYYLLKKSLENPYLMLSLLQYPKLLKYEYVKIK